MFGAISAKFRTFDMQIHFAIPPNSAFLGLLEEFFFSISNIRKFHHIINQFVKKFSTFPDSPYSNILAGQENYMLWIVNHASTGGFPFGGAYAIHGYLTNPIYQTWDDKDIRKQLWSNVSFGLGPNTLVSTKFIDREAITKDGGANDDPVYGYSDLLFIFAEASIKANGRVTQEAVDAVNQIHRRAYGQDPLNPSDCDFKLRDYNSVDSFMNVIIKERGYEFQLEGKRWLELKRTGLAKKIIKEAKDKDVSDISFLWPIPINEMNNNKALDPSKDQNPGY